MHALAPPTEISIDDADDLYREIRIENTLTDEKGKETRLKEGKPKLKFRSKQRRNPQRARHETAKPAPGWYRAVPVNGPPISKRESDCTIAFFLRYLWPGSCMKKNQSNEYSNGKGRIHS
jgi:hypothetical protein